MNKKIIFSFLVLMSGISSKSFSQFPANEMEFRKYFVDRKDSLDPIEGIWRVSTTQEYYHDEKLYDVDKIPQSTQVVIIKKDRQFDSYNLQGESYNVRFLQTDVRGVYIYSNYFPETKEYSKTNAVISKSGEMDYDYNFPDNFLRQKLGDGYEPGIRVLNKTRWVKIFPE